VSESSPIRNLQRTRAVNISPDPSGDHRIRRNEASGDDLPEVMTCKKCKVTMKELKGHIFHKKRKWQCPQCRKIKMQKPKSKGEAHDDH
jgi:hypothetical protein